MTKQDKIDELNRLATALTGMPEIKDREYAKCYHDPKKNRQIERQYSNLFKLDRKIL
jgi:hypothetical protein